MTEQETKLSWTLLFSYYKSFPVSTVVFHSFKKKSPLRTLQFLCIWCSAELIQFFYPLFLTDLSVKHRNYHAIHSRITALHTFQKWYCAITALSSTVSTLLLLKKKNPQTLCFWKTNIIVLLVTEFCHLIPES